MTHKTHSYLMVGLLAVGAVLFFTGGVGGGALFLIWPLLCMGMMFVMMWSMGGMFGKPTKPGVHTHDDGVTHSHDEVPTSSRR